MLNIFIETVSLFQDRIEAEPYNHSSFIENYIDDISLDLIQYKELEKHNFINYLTLLKIRTKNILQIYNPLFSNDIEIYKEIIKMCDTLTPKTN